LPVVSGCRSSANYTNSFQTLQVGEILEMEIVRVEHDSLH